MYTRLRMPDSLKTLSRYDLMAVRSLFRSLFMEEWQLHHSSWQEAITNGALEWSFTSERLREIAAELGELLTYPNSAIAKWLPEICSGLPHGSPDPELTVRDFIVQVRGLVSHMADEWERNGKPKWTSQS